MAFTNAIILSSPPRLSRATTYVATRPKVFLPARLLQDRPIRFATTYVSTRPKVFLPARRLQQMRIRPARALVNINRGTARIRTFMRILGMGSEFFPGDDTVKLTLFVRQNPQAIRSAILPNSTGEVSHARILVVQRTEDEAERMFNIMKEMP